MNMKKLLFVLASAVLLVSCGTVAQDTKRIVDIGFLDFRPYTEQGFLLTPNMYTGEYTACGLLEVNVFPAKKAHNSPGHTNEYGNYVIGSSTVTVEEISSQELISLAVDTAKELGADAICNFKCVSHYNNYFDGSGHSRQEFSHYEISGFCIKRK